MDIATQTHLTSLRSALEFRLATLRADVRAAQFTGAQAQDTPGIQEVGDTKDLAERLQSVELDEAQQRLDLAELADAEAALQRLDSGCYGDCADCGQPISLARLQLLPAAPRCAVCQRLHENSPRA